MKLMTTKMILFFILTLLFSPSSFALGIAQPIAETDPVVTGDDAIDDPAIWLHPTDVGKSVVIGTNKEGGLHLYNLKGKELFSIQNIRFNNVDVLYNVPFGGQFIDIAVASEKTKESFVVYQIMQDGKYLKQISPFFKNKNRSYGICLYHSQRSNRFYAFISGKDGGIEQWEIFDGGNKQMVSEKVREMKLKSITEGCVADHEYGVVYFAEEMVGLWRFGAEPTDTAQGTLLYSIKNNPTFLQADLEGLSIYYRSGGEGQIILSVQSKNEFATFDRVTNNYLGSFSIGHHQISGGEIDEVTHTDGIDIISTPLGSQYPYGMMVVQDDENQTKEGEIKGQNFKYVPVENISRAMNGKFSLDNKFNPRRLSRRF